MAKAKTTLAGISGVVLRKNKNRTGTYSLYLDIHKNGERYKEYLGESFLLTNNRDEDRETLRKAEAVATKRADEIRDSEQGLKSTWKSKADFLEYFASFIPSKPKAWINTYKHLKAFSTGKTVQFAAITPEYVHRWKEYLMKDLSQNSARTYYGCFVAALNLAVENGIIQRNPCSSKKGIPYLQTTRAFLTADEVRLLESTTCSNDTIKNAFLFSCFTGLRLCDVKTLTWSMIQPEGIQLVQQKTQKVVYMALNDKARKYMGAAGNDDDFIFPLSHNDEHTRKILKRWTKQAGIKKNISFHNARHTFATLLVDKDVSIYVVSKLLGHSDLRHTQIYAQMVDHKKHEAVSLLDSI